MSLAIARILPWIFSDKSFTRPVTLPEAPPSFANVVQYGASAFPNNNDNNVSGDGIDELFNSDEMVAGQPTVSPVPPPAPTPQQPLICNL